MNITSFRKTLAGVVLAGGLLVGAAATASAETGSTGATTKPTAEQRCERAQHVWERLEAFDERLHENYQRLGTLRDKQAAAGHANVAAKLTTRLDKIKDRHGRVEARMVKVHDKAAGTCTLPEVAPTPLG